MTTAVDPSAVARVVGIKTDFRNLAAGNVFYLPMRVGIVGQGATSVTYSTDKRQVFSSTEVGNTYGFGSPLHLAALQCLPVNGDGLGTIPLTIFPMDDDGSGVAAAGDITPAVTTVVKSSYRVVINNIRSNAFLAEVGDTVAALVTKMTAAINATPELPMTAVDSTTKVDLTAKWKGQSGNDLYLETEGPVDKGVTFAFTQPTSGATNPTVDASLAQLGEVWETFLINCLDVADTTALGTYADVNEGRWDPLIYKPYMVFSGTTESSVTTAIVTPESRKSDRTNIQEPSPGSKDLPFIIAARAATRAAKRAAGNPPYDYARLALSGVTPGTDAQQWNAAEREAAVRGGSSTTRLTDGVVQMSDTVTFYHPTGDPTPAYRYAVDQIKIWNIIYNTSLIFNSLEWDGAPLIPDDQATTNAAAKKPKMAKAAIAAMLDNLALEAIISDPATAKASIVAVISSQNPKRLDITFTVQLSGNVNIISIDFNFGFYFGEAPVVG